MLSFAPCNPALRASAANRLSPRSPPRAALPTSATVSNLSSSSSQSFSPPSPAYTLWSINKPPCTQLPTLLSAFGSHQTLLIVSVHFKYNPNTRDLRLPCIITAVSFASVTLAHTHTECWMWSKFKVVLVYSCRGHRVFRLSLTSTKG